MKIGKVTQYGFFDSDKQFGNIKKTPKRTVKEFEVDYILECGKDSASFVDDVGLPIRPQTIVFRKPEQISYSILNFKCYCLHLSVQSESPFFAELSALPNFFTFIDGKAYKTVFEQLFRHLSDNGVDCEDYFVAAKLLELFYLLKTDAVSNAQIRSAAVARESESIRRATEYVRKHYNQKITLEVLGKVSGYTPNHFQRVFKQITRVTPQKYLEDVRISQAKLLLCKQEKTISDIAYECGYSSQSHFSYAFKKATGLTPLHYRLSSAVALK